MGAVNTSTSSFAPALVSNNFDSQPFEFEYPDSVNDKFLLQDNQGTYRGVKTEKFLYVEYNNGEVEFYNRVADPYEMENLAAKLDPDILSSLHTWLGQLRTCAADDCRKLEANLPGALENYP
jgi:hypothetical protein